MIQTINFNPETDPKLRCTCGHALCDRRSVNQPTLNRLQRVRTIVDRPLKINSGGRCKYHPNEVHRKSPEDHQKCQGVDVACKNGIERGELVKVAIECGFNAIGVADGFVHLGHREELPIGAVVMWTY